MQEAPNPLAQLLGQLADLGVAVVLQGNQQDAAMPGGSQRPTPVLTLSLAMAVTLPASPTAQPVAAPSPANDNAEG